MKQLFLKLRELLSSIDGIEWVDFDKGQLNRYDTRPDIEFPAALVKINYPRTSKISRTQQQCAIQVIVKIAFDCMDDTDSSTTEEVLEQSLWIFDLSDQVHRILQGFIDIKIIRSPLDRVSVHDKERPDSIKVLEYTYSTSIID